MSEQPSHIAEFKAAASRQARPVQTMKAVFWSFFGVRRSAALADDVQKLNPVHLILAGILGAAVFVLSLILLIKWVVGSGIAA